MASENKDAAEHELLDSRRQTYSAFTKFGTYSIVAIAIVLILLALFLL